MRRTVITITPGASANDMPTVSYQDCHVSRGHGDEIEWRLTRPGTFSVEFPPGPGGSPFEPKYRFNDADPVSGPPTVADSDRRYKYRVTVPGNLPLDPDVIVDQ
ncbi:MAG TPA: hypothetical protein VHM88_05035 [Candidatus Acidoferrales bacterium]|jgi:hypothetical protein|nr:hypothetical protein [Candidatus Acidoferrales bacterium]